MNAHWFQAVDHKERTVLLVCIRIQIPSSFVRNPAILEPIGSRHSCFADPDGQFANSLENLDKLHVFKPQPLLKQRMAGERDSNSEVALGIGGAGVLLSSLAALKYFAFNLYSTIG